MKGYVIAVFAVLGICMAAEPIRLPLELGSLKTRDGKSYDGVKVVGSDAVGIRIIHEGGTGRIPFANLPKDVADRFAQDPAKAKAQLEKEAGELAANDRAMNLATDPAGKSSEKKPDSVVPGADSNNAAEDMAEDELPDNPVEAIPADDGKAKAERIASLQNYVRRLEFGIQKAQEEAKQRTERAQKIAASARSTEIVIDSSGSHKTIYKVNKSRIRRAEYIRKQVILLGNKIGEANVLIKNARVAINSLQADAPEN